MIMCRHKRKDQLIKVLLIDEWSLTTGQKLNPFGLLFNKLYATQVHLRNCCINSRSVSTTAQTPGHNSSLDIAAPSSLRREKLLEPL